MNHLFQQIQEFVQQYGVFGVFVGFVTIMAAFFPKQGQRIGESFKKEFRKNPWLFLLLFLIIILLVR
ncbi:hypothetical protein [Mesobacillus foraminis]|uniref:Uncharacterized protein n=1 Tax=Mesobacillus foraminis TaxID=279826 RepID=A0A4R2B375_9BACI|nr:hypothetical protein [Mesobacillus foraminis]TCN21087.1 hypothetical protein EV146_11311 [Mesobacillus foraminis]